MERLHESAPTLYNRETDHAPLRLIFIITASPVLASAVGDYFRGLHDDLSVVWLTSAERALNRPGLEHAAWVILDDLGPSTEANVVSLSAAAPDAKIMLLAGGNLPEATFDKPYSSPLHELHTQPEAGARRGLSSLLRFHRLP